MPVLNRTLESGWTHPADWQTVGPLDAATTCAAASEATLARWPLRVGVVALTIRLPRVEPRVPVLKALRLPALDRSPPIETLAIAGTAPIIVAATAANATARIYSTPGL